MQKIPTLFVRDPANMSRVTREVTPGCEWVLEGIGIPTRKRDGTNIQVEVYDGVLRAVWKRRNPTRDEKAQGVEPSYIPCPRADPQNQHIWATIDPDFSQWPDGSWPCEALGPKIQGGIEGGEPRLYPFSLKPEVLNMNGYQLSFEGIKGFLEDNVMEGIVFYDLKGTRLAKIKSKDFGLPWPVK